MNTSHLFDTTLPHCCGNLNSFFGFFVKIFRQKIVESVKNRSSTYSECRGEHCSPANLAQHRLFGEIYHRANGHGRAMPAPQTVEKGAFTPWPPLRGGSARRRWGRELYGCPKYFGLWQGSLPPPLRGTSLAEGGFSTRCAFPQRGRLFVTPAPARTE